MAAGRWCSAERSGVGREQAAEIPHGFLQHPGDGAFADLEHMGGDGLCLALEQEFDQQPRPGFEQDDRLAQPLVHRFVIRDFHGGVADDADVVEVGDGRERFDVPFPPPTRAGDVEGTAAGHHADPCDSDVSGHGVQDLAATWLEGFQGVGAAGGRSQSADVVEHQAEHVVDGGKIANAAVAKRRVGRPADDGLADADQCLKRIEVSMPLPAQQQVGDAAGRGRVWSGGIPHEGLAHPKSPVSAMVD